MQELIAHYPELYSMVVLYTGDKLPNLLILCKDSYQVIMHHKLYNSQIQIYKHQLYGGSIKFGLNLRKQLHGICDIHFMFGKIKILYCEGLMVDISLNDVMVLLHKLRKRIFELVSGEYRSTITSQCISYGVTTIHFHKNGAIKRYDIDWDNGDVGGFGFRKDFSLAYNWHTQIMGLTKYCGNNTAIFHTNKL